MTGLNDLQKDFDLIGDVRGLGPMIALELVKDQVSKTPAPLETKAITDYCFEKGLILLACGCYGNVLRFMMPLVTTDKQLNTGLEIIKEAFESVKNN